MGADSFKCKKEASLKREVVICITLTTAIHPTTWPAGLCFLIPHNSPISLVVISLWLCLKWILSPSTPIWQKMLFQAVPCPPTLSQCVLSWPCVQTLVPFARTLLVTFWQQGYTFFFSWPPYTKLGSPHMDGADDALLNNFRWKRCEIWQNPGEHCLEALPWPLHRNRNSAFQVQRTSLFGFLHMSLKC